jgi:hypothetical protein
MLVPALMAEYASLVLSAVPVPTINFANAHLPGVPADVEVPFVPVEATAHGAVIVLEANP